MASEIRTVIVDDEPVARAGIRKLLAHEGDIRVVAEAGTGADAVRAILEHEPDLLFLDIQMPEMNGFDVLHAIGADRMPIVIFVTAWDQFAVRAFEVQALDYLLKPFDDERFTTVLERARRQLHARREHDLAARLETLLAAYEDRSGDAARRSRASADAGAVRAAPEQRRPRPYLKRIILRESGRVSFQPVDEIDWIEAADYYARLHVGKQTHLVREPLSTLEKQLDPAQFVRVHRSAIVNVRRIRELRPDWRNRHVLVLANGTTVPLSRSRKKVVERILSRAAS